MLAQMMAINQMKNNMKNNMKNMNQVATTVDFVTPTWLLIFVLPPKC
jgi:hypothetical protein